MARVFQVRGYPTIWFVTPEINEGKVNFNKLGKQGYVRGGPNTWIAGANNFIAFKPKSSSPPKIISKTPNKILLKKKKSKFVLRKKICC